MPQINGSRPAFGLPETVRVRGCRAGSGPWLARSALLGFFEELEGFVPFPGEPMPDSVIAIIMVITGVAQFDQKGYRLRFYIGSPGLTAASVVRGPAIGWRRMRMPSWSPLGRKSPNLYMDEDNR